MPTSHGRDTQNQAESVTKDCIVIGNYQSIISEQFCSADTPMTHNSDAAELTMTKIIAKKNGNSDKKYY